MVVLGNQSPLVLRVTAASATPRIIGHVIVLFVKMEPVKAVEIMPPGRETLRIPVIKSRVGGRLHLLLELLKLLRRMEGPSTGVPSVVVGLLVMAPQVILVVREAMIVREAMVMAMDPLMSTYFSLIQVLGALSLIPHPQPSLLSLDTLLVNRQCLQYLHPSA